MGNKPLAECIANAPSAVPIHRTPASPREQLTQRPATEGGSSRKAALIAALPAEPLDSEEGTICVGFSLPSGSLAARRFRASDTVQVCVCLCV
jgi:hypothetical protein